MTTRTKQKQKTYDTLLGTAKELFATQGLAATRTLDVAKQAGVSHGTVFAHFPTREDLLIQAIEDVGNAITARTHELAAQGVGIRAVLDAHLGAIQEHEMFYTRLISETPLLPEAARNTLIGIQSAVSHHLFIAAKQDMDAGLIRPMPMHLLFNTWVGLIHYYLTNHDLFSPGSAVIEEKGQELVEHFINLIQTHKES